MTFIKSDIDNEYYMVRDLPDKQQACNTIATMKQKVNILIDYLYKKNIQILMIMKKILLD